MMTSPDTIANIHALFREEEITPLDLLELCLDRIDQKDANVQAWVLVDRDGAQRIAEAQTRQLRDQSGVPLPPLFGIPLGIKDIIDVAGWPTKAGSPLHNNHVADADATIVSRLRQAGAILLGKTVTTQFASFDPSITRNPWHHSHTPGGSSSGSAAAVASRMCVAAVGTQTGGSIIRPASYCGVVGLKPTYGSVPVEGVVPLAPTLDHVGPIVRNVADAARIFGVLSGSTSTLKDNKPIRFGIVRDFFVTEADAEMAAVFDAVMVHLENNLGPVEIVELPDDVRDIHRLHRMIMAFECAAYHKTWYPSHQGDYLPHLSQLIEEGLSISPAAYAHTRDQSSAFVKRMRQVFDAYDVLAMPSTSGPAPGLETTGDPRWQNVWSLSRFPSITLPCGFASFNLPLGLQLVGRDDPQLLQIAEQCEEVLGLAEDIDRLLG